MSKGEEKTVTEVKLETAVKKLTKELTQANEQIIALEAVDESRLTDDELATQIVAVMSKELHLRVGIGPIWRQLNPTRKKEIIEKWTADTTNLLLDNR
jgi:hypothetical protein